MCAALIGNLIILDLDNNGTNYNLKHNLYEPQV